MCGEPKGVVGLPLLDGRTHEPQRWSRERSSRFFEFESNNNSGLNLEVHTPAGVSQYNLKGLILAQNERWRRGLGMQVGGIPAMGEPA